MEIEFQDENLKRLEIDPNFDAGFHRDIVRGVRKCLNAIRAAPDERLLYQSRGLRYHKLQGNRQHQHALSINDQYRLIVERKDGTDGKTLVVIGVEDYH